MDQRACELPCTGSVVSAAAGVLCDSGGSSGMDRRAFDVSAARRVDSSACRGEEEFRLGVVLRHRDGCRRRDRVREAQREDGAETEAAPVSIVLDGRHYEIPGVTSITCAETTFRRPRVFPIEFIVLHSTGDAAVQTVTPGSKTPTNPMAWCDADTRESDARTASWDATIRSDGVLLWNNDPVKYEDYHATVMNPRSMGIELAQSPQIYQVQVDTAVKVLDFLTAYLGIQRQVPSDRRVTTRLSVDGGADYNGVVGHRNGDSNRSDPGDGVFNALRAAGYESFDLVAGQDKSVWMGRQAVLGVPQTGFADTATRAALMARGYPDGIWVKRGGASSKKGWIAAGLLAVAAGAAAWVFNDE